MMKLKWILIAVSGMMFFGCGEQTQKGVAEVTPKSIRVNEASSTEATDATKKTATKLAKNATEAASKGMENMKQGAENTLKKAKEELTEVVVAQTPGNAGKTLYIKCAGCHGVDGKKHALGKSAVIAGQSASDLADKLKAYKVGTRNVTGMGNMMKGQVASLSKQDILALADHISRLK